MFPTSHVALVVRTLVDPADPAHLAEVVALQDRLRIDAVSANAPSHPQWDADSLDRTRALLMKLADGLTAFDGAFGSCSETDPILHLIGTAAGWGGLPTTQATYIGVSPNLPVGHHVLKVPRDVACSILASARRCVRRKRDPRAGTGVIALPRSQLSRRNGRTAASPRRCRSRVARGLRHPPRYRFSTRSADPLGPGSIVGARPSARSVRGWE